MKVHVHVQLKTGVLDPQGRAIADALRGLGYAETRDARVGKVIALDLDETDPARAGERAKAMAEALLANPVIESYRVEVVG
jgi:phosphoribosylformylglycinamidine synthase PurS subunit